MATKLKSLDELVADLEAAKEAFTEGVLAHIEKAARRHKLDTMAFYFTTVLTRNKRVVEVEEIEKIEEVYLNHLDKTGFLAGWTKEEGWQ